MRAKITGLNYRVTVSQTFRNALDEALEATYIFPLPDRAAVTGFQLRVGDRVIDGELKERGQARADYEQAIRDGHRAAIAEEERSGTFSLRVGNIPPKEEVQVELTLVGPLPVAAGRSDVSVSAGRGAAVRARRAAGRAFGRCAAGPVTPIRSPTPRASRRRCCSPVFRTPCGCHSRWKWIRPGSGVFDHRLGGAVSQQPAQRDHATQVRPGRSVCSRANGSIAISSCGFP